jgi:DNA-binding NtrC family response regulator
MPHILIIDDDLLICQLLRQALEKEGYTVSEAHEGKKGLAAHQARPADLVVTDLVMPGMEGIETIMEMKRRYPGMKIIAMSGGGIGKGVDYLAMARKFGAHRTIAKPFNIHQLVATVGEVIAGAPPSTASEPRG